MRRRLRGADDRRRMDVGTCVESIARASLKNNALMW
jgi:hypothetical protein